VLRTDRCRRHLKPVTILCVSLVTMWALAAPSTTLALSGSSSSGNAASAQYLQPGHRTRVTTTVEGNLPFTGYAVLSVFAIGLCLASGGVLVRARTRRHRP
jgi:hypothetical protein